MAEGGKLTIETANAYLDAVYAARHDEVVAGRHVLITVTDTGSGMAPEVAARAFEPFYTTKGIGQGSGLGLSQVFGFVKQSGGHVKIYSEVGRGTSVKIYLPCIVGEESPELEGSAAPAALPRASQEETILIVEDEADVRAYGREVLTQLGYRVIEAEDAHSGLAALEANPEVVLLFTDVGLPGMNGRDLAKEALRRRPDLRVLYTTGYTSYNSALDRGAHLLTKPFSMVALATKIRKAIETVS
jgi:CheY-like chemotaxis protein